VAHFESPFGHVFLLADGMGGYRDGAIASSLATSRLPGLLAAIPLETEAGEALVQAIQEVNLAIIEEGRAMGNGERGMGSTLAALLVRQIADGVIALGAHVGDSRIYFLRGDRLFRLTRDHTVVQQLLDMGSLTPVQAEDHPQASVLTRALGRQGALVVDITQWLLLRPGDTLLLCSDGLSGFVRDESIAGALSRNIRPEQVVDALVELAVQERSSDNISVLVVRAVQPCPAST
jgi:protein phosphatase